MTFVDYFCVACGGMCISMYGNANDECELSIKHPIRVEGALRSELFEMARDFKYRDKAVLKSFVERAALANGEPLPVVPNASRYGFAPTQTRLDVDA